MGRHPEFCSRAPESPDAGGLIEELIYEHDELFLDRIEVAIMEHPIVREVVQQAYVGGLATNGAERFQRLQEVVRSRATYE